MYVGFEPVLFMLLIISDYCELSGADCGTYNPILVLCRFTGTVCIYTIRIYRVPRS